MKKIHFLLFFVVVVCIYSCNTSKQDYFYEQKHFKKIKSLKKNKKYTYLERGEPERDLESVREFLDEVKEYRFNKEIFQNEEAIFVLNGINTFNFAELNKIEMGNQIAIDSSACNAFEFLYLTLNPVRKGEYQVIASGCHHYKIIKLSIE